MIAYQGTGLQQKKCSNGTGDDRGTGIQYRLLVTRCSAEGIVVPVSDPAGDSW